MLPNVIIYTVFLIIRFYLAVLALVIIDIPRFFIINVSFLRPGLILPFKVFFYTTVKVL